MSANSEMLAWSRPRQPSKLMEALSGQTVCRCGELAKANSVWTTGQNTGKPEYQAYDKVHVNSHWCPRCGWQHHKVWGFRKGKAHVLLDEHTITFDGPGGNARVRKSPGGTGW